MSPIEPVREALAPEHALHGTDVVAPDTRVATDSEVDLDDDDRLVLERMRRINPSADPHRYLPGVPLSRIPRHVAFIMDGNGRWASERGFPRMMGHRTGAATVRAVVKRCGLLGIEAVTLYSFSSENWSRPPEEVAALMELCVMYFDGEREELVRENLRVRTIGNIDALPAPVVASIRATEDATRECTGPVLCLAINYGSRDEIVRAVRRIAERASAGEIDPGDIDQSVIAGALDTAGLPDPDLLIRTGGDFRVSNFLLWQISYAEIFVTPTYWPEFGVDELERAIESFASRQRRYGGLEARG